VARQIWLIIASGFFESVFYLFAVGVGIGELVGDVAGPGGRPVEYAAFVAPALLSASAMNGAVFESTNIYFKLKWAKIYDAVVATPLNPGDIAIAEISWSLIRGGMYSTGFLVVMSVLGYMPSKWGWLALPGSLLVGFAFAAVGMAAVTFMRSWQDFDLITLAILPLFLFSATFYPITVYPGWLQLVARISPLYHGVELIRSLTLGAFDITLVGHVMFLLVMGLVGLAISARRIGNLLLR
jgi:lipooligosaccharide transport system permease protein